MIVKVNRLNSVKDIKNLLSIGVDIIGISVKLNPESKDGRALSIEEVLDIKSKITIPNLSINLNAAAYKKDDLSKICNKLNPQSLNLFLENSSIRDAVHLNGRYLETINSINNTKIDVIAFGNGFDYDGAIFNPKHLNALNCIKYYELSFHTLDSNSQLKIRTRAEWAKALNVEEREVKQENCDTILETIIETMKGYKFLVDDNIIGIPIETLKNIGASGITLSLESSKNDVYVDKQTNINKIASRRSIDGKHPSNYIYVV